jgi:NAD(P)-dependent dehydrogenase (short-subunit alcohol dehydrogenase family)
MCNTWCKRLGVPISLSWLAPRDEGNAQGTLERMEQGTETVEQSALFATYPSLRGRVVVITGGASGIGEAIVEAFAMQKAQVAFLDIDDDAATRLGARLAVAGGPEPVYYHCDLACVPEAQSTVRSILKKFGTIDVLINNAGNDMRHKIDEVTPELWDKTIAVNLKHQFFMAQAAIPSMQKAQRGSIINMSSIGWVIPSTNQVVYVTAKAAVVGMTRTLAHELGADNIRVNCIMPGWILTERQQRLWLTEENRTHVLANQALKRMIMPDEVARLALFLAADDSSAITNQSYVIDAGWV